MNGALQLVHRFAPDQQAVDGSTKRCLRRVVTEIDGSPELSELTTAVATPDELFLGAT